MTGMTGATDTSLRDDRIHPAIVRVVWNRGHHLERIGQAEQHRGAFRAGREAAIVVAAASPEPPTLRVEGQTRYQHEIPRFQVDSRTPLRRLEHPQRSGPKIRPPFHRTEREPLQHESGQEQLLPPDGEPAERDGGAEPGEAYWAQFNERLHRRIADETRGRRTRAVAILAAAAALLAAVLLGTWILRPDPVAVATGTGPARAGEEDPLLVAGVNDVEGILGAFDGWDGFDLDTAGDDPLWVESENALFPDTADLDADTRRQLLEWLGEQESRLDGGPA